MTFNELEKKSVLILGFGTEGQATYEFLRKRWPEKALTISAKTHHSNVDYNLFEGTEVQGAPEVVLVRGQVIVEDDELVAQPGAGQFMRRARFGEQLAPVAKAVA